MGTDQALTSLSDVGAWSVKQREWQEGMEQLIDAVNVALEVGDWAAVVTLTQHLYECASAARETELAELVQDLHWIANDALAHPLKVAVLVQA